MAEAARRSRALAQSCCCSLACLLFSGIPVMLNGLAAAWSAYAVVGGHMKHIACWRRLAATAWHRSSYGYGQCPRQGPFNSSDAYGYILLM